MTRTTVILLMLGVIITSPGQVNAQKAGAEFAVETRLTPDPSAGAVTAVEQMMQYLPDQVLAFVATSGGDVLRSGFDQSMLGKIWREPGLQKIIQSLDTQLMPLLQQEMGPEEAQIFEAIRLLAEQVIKRPIIAGVAQKPNTQEIPFYGFIFVDAGDRKEQINAAWKQAEALTDPGGIVEVKVGPYTLHGPNEPGDLHGYWGFVENYFVFAINEGQGLALKYFNQKAPHPATSYNRALAEIPAADDALVIFADFEKAYQLMRAVSVEAPENLAIANSILDQLGLSKIKTFAGRVGFDGPDMVQSSLLEMPEPHTGLFNCLQKADMKQLAQAPAEAVSVALINVDTAQMYDTVMGTIKSVAPTRDYEEIQAAITGFEQEIGVQIRNGLLASLKGPMTIYSLPGGAGAANPVIPVSVPVNSFVIIADLKDSALMERSLTALENFAAALAGAQLQITTEKVNDLTMHVWLSPVAALMQITPCWAVSQDKLIISGDMETGIAALGRLQAADPDQPSFLTSAAFKERVPQLPDNLLAFTYTDSKFHFRQLLATIRPLWPTAVALAKQQAGIDLPLIFPSFAGVVDQMPASCSYYWVDEKGIHSHSRGPVTTDGTTGVAAAALGVSILMPALGRARELAKRVQCMSNLSAIGRSIVMYQGEFRDQLPTSLEELIEKEGLDPKSLLCPSSRDEVGQCSYIYRGADLKDRASEEMILVHDKYDNHKGECRNVLFANSSVKRLTEEEFQKAIAYDNQLRRQKHLPEKPADK